MDKPDKINCDVLVIGGGGAGLAAAIEARATSAYVVLVEKNPELGGTTAWSIGSFTATQTPQQIAKNIKGQKAYTQTPIVFLLFTYLKIGFIVMPRRESLLNLINMKFN